MNTHETSVTIECEFFQKEFLWDAAKMNDVSPKFRHWALSILMKEAEKVLGMSFRQYKKKKTEGEIYDAIKRNK